METNTNTSTVSSSQLGASILDQLNGGNESTVDVSTIVSALLSTETGLKISSLTTKQEAEQEKQAAFELFEGAITGFSSIMTEISQSLQSVTKSATISDDRYASVSVDASVNNGNYSLDVLSLASKQSLSTSTYGAPSTVVGSGTLTIEQGSFIGSFDGSGSSVDIVVAAGTTVSQLVDQINQSSAGVQAYMVNTTQGVQIAMSSSETGEENGFSVTVADSDGDSLDSFGLSAFQYNDTTKNMNLGQVAVDSKVLFDGVALSSANNRFKDSVVGFDITVKEVTGGSPSLITVSDDIESSKGLLEEFITSYNSVIQIFDYLGDAEEGEESQGVLYRDRDFALLEKSFRTIAEGAVAGYGGTAFLNSLGVGYSKEDDYQLELDETIFQAALAKDPSAVKTALTQLAVPTDPLVSFVSAESYTVAGNYSPVEVTTPAETAKMFGVPSGSLIIDATNDDFTFSVNGESTGAIKLSQGTYGSFEELAVQLQAKINSNLAQNNVSVSYNGSSFELDSGSYGSLSTVEFLSAEAGFETLFGYATGVSASGVDVMANIGAGVGIGSGQMLEVLTGDAAGLKLEIKATTAGFYGDVLVTDGIAKSLSDYVSGITSTTGFFTQILDTYEENIADRAERLADLDERTEVLRTKYTVLYSELNATIISMQATQDQLQAQFDAWNAE
ncbi:flagellar filament capping protein FliD [Pseudoalteromonas marina]|uniref:Flagellar hook-associated protein 2 n=2 Tax=Bacteria TaxID=2 RepID=A0ABT9FC28_9GAMM|nr:flagellar filament capping protein FliD [Pseudoalteromonas marina]MDP2564342.1 flagellar filament capping protein FliD [Pseudoalteromonas marina]